MRITEVTVNYSDRNYFNDYDEFRSDSILGIDETKIIRAIEKLHRRFVKSEKTDCMFITNEDGTGWRLMYDYDRENFDPKKSKKELRLRHYVKMSTDSWDTEEPVSLAKAKRLILQ